MSTEERSRRWRLVLGKEADDGIGKGTISGTDLDIDSALSALYDADPEKKAGLGKSAPNVARWLGDIRKYFPSSVVQVMQKDALERLNLKKMLLEPELLSTVEADVHLVANLIALSSAIPARTRETARQVVRKVVEQVMSKLANPTRQAIIGSLNRSQRNLRPRHNEIDWNKTILRNLKHYQRDLNTIIPEQKIGYGRKRSTLKHIILCVDQSGSMGTSIVYSGIFGAVLSSIPAISTRLVVFDTAVADLTEKVSDPVDLLFSTRLGGGTDINRALTYCQQFIRVPNDTILVLISDLYEGGNQKEMLKRVNSIKSTGCTMVALLALSDDGAPIYDAQNAAAFAALEIPAFACTPDLFPDMIATVIANKNIHEFLTKHNIQAARI